MVQFKKMRVYLFARALQRALYRWCARLFWYLTRTSKMWRAVVFDEGGASPFHLTPLGDIRYLVSSRDRVVGRMAYLEGQYEYGKLQKVMSILRNDDDWDLIVDVGANIGTICIPAVRNGYFRKALAVEPDPVNFRILAANIYLNDLATSIDLHNIALSDFSGAVLSFELSDTNFGDHRVRVTSEDGRLGEAGRKVIKVPSMSMDDLMAGVEHRCDRSLIWMDTQGYEGFVLKGGSRTLQAKVPMVIEFWPYGMERARSYDALRAAILAAGYETFYNLSDDHPVPLEVTGAALDHLYQQLSQMKRSTDLLFTISASQVPS